MPILSRKFPVLSSQVAKKIKKSKKTFIFEIDPTLISNDLKLDFSFDDKKHSQKK